MRVPVYPFFEIIFEIKVLYIEESLIKCELFAKFTFQSSSKINSISYISTFHQKGLWQVDTRHGKGTYYYANGDVYEGEWFRNRKNGTGKYTYKDSNSSVS